MSVNIGRIIVKRAAKEVARALPAFIAEFLTELALSLKCDGVGIHYDKERDVLELRFCNANECKFKVTIEGGKEVYEYLKAEVFG